MNITCPNCTTSYGVDAEAFGTSGRNVRCARCHEIWLAYPDPVAVAPAFVPATMTAEDAGSPVASSGGPLSSAGEWHDDPAPMVDSPSIVHDGGATDDWATTIQAETVDQPTISQPARPRFRLPRLRPGLAGFRVGLPVAIAAMGALVFALIVWRRDVVRLLPQTASVFKAIRLDVNLRNLTFDDVKVRTETVENKPVLVIEGAIVGTTRKPVEIPRLRFILRDARGTEIYAWSAILEQSVLKPGERAPFRSRLAAPPPEAHDIAVRFFNRRDVIAGGL
jgi:predicted Zn finger-like uncharacterized protein